ncbi:MAG TPA: PQQ-binding-like beta-propeller repeat protein, partial [bacterium]|nr:PQQ-binding-like beta-propeller repeat protein [bacterium]
LSHPTAIIDRIERSVLPHQSYELNANSSYWGDNPENVKIEWKCLKDSAENNNTLSNLDKLYNSFNPTIKGNYKVMLTIEDTQNRKSFDSFDICVGLVWTKDSIPGGGFSSVVDEHGTFYFASSGWYDLSAVNDDAKIKWQLDLPRPIASEMTLFNDHIYFTTYGDKSYVIDMDGTIVSQKNTVRKNTVFSENVMYYIYDKTPYSIVAVKADSLKNIWRVTGDGFFNNLAQGPDGTIYTMSGGLLAISKYGKPKWKIKLNKNYQYLAIDPNGEYIVLSGCTGLCKIKSNGVLLWEINKELINLGGIVIDVNDNIYQNAVYSSGSQFYILIEGFDKDGNTISIHKWPTGVQDVSPPLLGNDNSIYFTSSDAVYYEFNKSSNSTTVLKLPREDQSIQGRDASIYIQDNNPMMNNKGIVSFIINKRLYAIMSSSDSLDSFGYPSFNYNNKNNNSSFNAKFPCAVVSAPQFVELDKPFSLDGKISYKPMQGKYSYRWAVLDSNRQSSVFFSEPNNEMTYCTITKPGIYHIQLLVFDAEGRTSCDIAEIYASITWKTAIPKRVNDGLTNLAIDANSNIYLGSKETNKLYSYSKNGIKNWEVTLDGGYFSDPVIDPSNNILLASNLNKIYSINPLGVKNWYLPIPFYYSQVQTPSISSLGSSFISGSSDNVLLQLDINGQIKSEYLFQEPLTGAVLHTSEGNIVVKSTNNTIYCLDKSGVVKWSKKIKTITDVIPIGNNDMIYFETEDKKLHCLNSSGSEYWDVQLDEKLTSPIAIGMDGELYFGVQGKSFVSLSSKGDIKWSYMVDSDIFSSPVLGSDDTIYVVTNNGVLYAFNTKGSLIWSLAGLGETTISPAITKDGLLIVASDEGNMYAIQTKSRGLASSAWPKYRHDNMNTCNRNTVTTNAAIYSYLPLIFGVSSNFPNPFNGQTRFKVTIPDQRRFEARVYNLLGQMVKVIYQGNLVEGEYEFIWDGTDMNGKKSGTGVYILHANTENFSYKSKMLLLQ